MLDRAVSRARLLALTHRELRLEDDLPQDALVPEDETERIATIPVLDDLLRVPLGSVLVLRRASVCNDGSLEDEDEDEDEDEVRGSVNGWEGEGGPVSSGRHHVRLDLGDLARRRRGPAARSRGVARGPVPRTVAPL